MTPFAEALIQVRDALRNAGYPGAEISVLLPKADVLAVQRELVVARAILETVLDPTPPHFGARLLCVVAGVNVYVRDDA